MHRRFFLICSLILILMPSFVFSETAGTITQVAGRADILKAGAAAAAPVNVGDTVSVGDILRTKSDGRVEITFVDNSVMAVGPKSRLGIDEYLFKPDDGRREASLKLYRGKTGFKVPNPVYPASGSKFEMKTRTAVAGVRGTSGILYNTMVEKVYVDKGIVEFYNPFGSVIVTRGEVGEVIYGGAPTERPYTEMEFKSREGDVAPRETDKKTEGEKATPPPMGLASPPPLPPLPAQTAELLPSPSASDVLTPLSQPVLPVTDITNTSTSTNVTVNVIFP